MIWFAFIAFILGLAVLVLMRDEIRTGFFRWRDYLVVIPLLAIAAVAVVFLNRLLPAGDGLWFVLLLPVRLVLTFGLMAFVWGGTITAGALLLRWLGPTLPSERQS